jgi:outer membrane lipopolysaccharide assembly protein LptE/RlpB
MRTAKILGIFALSLFISCAISACGYRFAQKGVLPEGVDTVFVSVFENRSYLLGIENDFTNSMIQEFTRRRAGSLKEKEKADAVLKGVIKSISTGTVSHRDKYVAVERRVRVVLSVQLVNREGETVWAADNIRDNEVYMVETEKSATDQNLRQAVEKLADDLAQRIYNQMTVNF